MDHALSQHQQSNLRSHMYLHCDAIGSALELKNHKGSLAQFILQWLRTVWSPKQWGCKYAHSLSEVWFKLSIDAPYFYRKQHVSVSSWAWCRFLWAAKRGASHKGLRWSVGVYLCFLTQMLCYFGGLGSSYAKVKTGQIYNPWLRVFKNIWKSK